MPDSDKSREELLQELEVLRSRCHDLEARRRNSDTGFKGLVDRAGEGFLVADRSGRFLYANRKTFELHGYDEGEFMALNLSELDWPESAARFLQNRTSRFHRIVPLVPLCLRASLPPPLFLSLTLIPQNHCSSRTLIYTRNIV